jgi:hypothetical protein
VITKVLILQTPATIADVRDFIDECLTLSGGADQVPVRVFGKDLRFKWPSDSAVDEGNLTKGSGGVQ